MGDNVIVESSSSKLKFLRSECTWGGPHETPRKLDRLLITFNLTGMLQKNLKDDEILNIDTLTLLLSVDYPCRSEVCINQPPSTRHAVSKRVLNFSRTALFVISLSFPNISSISVL